MRYKDQELLPGLFLTMETKNIVILEAGKRVFASCKDSVSQGNINHLIVNDNPAIPTQHRDWSEIQGIPKKIESWYTPPGTNLRWELKPEYRGLNNLTEIIYSDDYYSGPEKVTMIFRKILTHI